jgi:cytidylate kinase
VGDARSVIAIDGPAGSGKSTTARAVARELGWQYLDTGAMYRALALAVRGAGRDLDDEEQVLETLGQIDIRFGEGFPPAVLLDGEDVSGRIRTPEAGEGASRVSVHPRVRRRMVELQRELGLAKPSVLEGRDTTTKIFPDAGLKIYLDASVETRARRRRIDYDKQGRDVPLEEIERELAERDRRDMQRAEGPLTKAPGAVVLDTDGWTLDEQIEAVLEIARETFGLGAEEERR